MKFYLSVFILFITSFWGCQPAKEKDFIISAASNLKFVLPELVEQFEKQTGQEVRLVFGSSGKLFAQIRSGAPYDIFLSANSDYPESIVENGLAHSDPVIFANGKLVLWSTQKSTMSFDNLLFDHSIKHIAIPNPELAPYGIAAYEYLHRIDSALHLQDKLIYAESVAQVNQFVNTGAVEIGFTSMSSVLSNSENQSLFWEEVPNNFYNTIPQTGVILNSTSNVKMAKEFLEFLTSSKSKNILLANGYSISK